MSVRTGRVYADVKRFRERWIADERFRIALESNPDEAARSRGLVVDPHPLAFLWRHGALADAASPEVGALRRMDQRGREFLAFCADDNGAIEPYRTWRARQIARAHFAVGSVFAPLGLHLPFAVELTRGCSLGCWFCALSASRLETVLELDPDAWKSMLLALGRMFGRSAARGFLYWATDPLDHPAYETYAETFRATLGRFPMTTTAAATRDNDRARRLIALASSGRCPALRFSVVSIGVLDTLHAEFTAKELADVDLVFVNRGSLHALAEAGHARRTFRSRPHRGASEREKLAKYGDADLFSHTTIACVSGFLIQPVEGRIRLISPEPASDRWEDGFVVFDEAEFDPDRGLDRALRDMAERSFRSEPPNELALQRGVSIGVRQDGTVVASGRGHEANVSVAERRSGYLSALCQAFRGGAAVAHTAGALGASFSVDARAVESDIAALWQGGALIETFFARADAGREAVAATAPVS